MTAAQYLLIIAGIGLASAVVIGLFTPLLIRFGGMVQAHIQPRLDHIFGSSSSPTDRRCRSTGVDEK